MKGGISVLKKFTSRKFLFTALAMVANMVLQFLPNNSVVVKIVAAVAALITVVSYVLVEGNVDAKAVSLSSDFASKIASALVAAGLLDTAKANTMTVVIDPETGAVTVNKPEP